MAPVTCLIIFTEETDREDWLRRCMASLEHPDVEVVVHRFAKADENATKRRVRIHNEFVSKYPEQWLMFADPDDHAVQPGYGRFIEYLESTEHAMIHPIEVVDPLGVEQRLPHHLIAVRGEKISSSCGKYHLALDKSIMFPEVAYQFNSNHGGNTGGDWRRRNGRN